MPDAFPRCRIFGLTNPVSRAPIAADERLNLPRGNIGEQNILSRVVFSVLSRVVVLPMDEIFTASQNFRAAKAQLLAVETEYRKQRSDEAARDVEAAMLRFDVARLALRQATRTTLPTT